MELFDSARKRLEKQYEHVVYDPESGLDEQGIQTLFEAHCRENPGEEHVLTKAFLLHLVCTKARIAPEPDNYFAGKVDPCASLFQKLRWKWVDELWPKEFSDHSVPGDQKMFVIDMEHSIGYMIDTSHTSPDWMAILKLGFPGLRDRAAKGSTALHRAAVMVYDGAIELCRRLGKASGNEALLALAERPPQTLREAFQLAYLFHDLQEIEGEEVRTMGWFDRLYIDFYRRDLKAGRLTRESAEELIQYFWIAFYAKWQGTRFGKNFCFGPEINELSYLGMEVYHKMNTVDPKLSVRVTPETRARVLAAARAVNFTMRKRIPQVGVLVSDLSGAKLTSYVTQLLRLTMQELVQRNCVIRLLESGQDDWPEEDHYDAIISLAYNESVNRVSSLYSVPVISLNNPLGTGDFYEIYSDHRQSAVLATEYLLTMGHRNIMLICFKKAVGSIVDWGMQERTAGFRETMDKFGLCSDLIAFTDSEPVDNILLRARSNGVTGLIVFSEDELRIPFLLSHIMKLRIPEEMSLIMEELPSVLDYYSPPITAVRQPFERMVAAIMERLDQIFAGDTAPADPVVFHNELVIRESVSRIGNAVCR